jgi:hypothetical protein
MRGSNALVTDMRTSECNLFRFRVSNKHLPFMLRLISIQTRHVRRGTPVATLVGSINICWRVVFKRAAAPCRAVPRRAAPCLRASAEQRNVAAGAPLRSTNRRAITHAARLNRKQARQKGKCLLDTRK